jgi:hypothetical protein
MRESRGIGDSWYAEPLGLASIDSAAHGKFGDALARHRWSRGVLLWLLGRRHEFVVTTLAELPRSFLLLERLFPRRTRYIVILEFIPVIGNDAQVLWGAGGGRARRLLVRLIWRWMTVPTLRRALLVAQCLTEWETRRSAAELGVSPGRFRFIPWFRCAEAPNDPHGQDRAGVLASGRAACYWETVFAAARGQNWPLTVVCSGRDLALVSRLNHDNTARVLCEIPKDAHSAEVASCLVYLLALRDAEVSSGQVRLSDAWEAGTPVVASSVRGLEGYLADGHNSLVFPPGDPEQARAAVAILLGDENLRASLRRSAAENAIEWTRDDYLKALRSLLSEAVALAASEA